MAEEKTEKLSDYDPNSSKAMIGDEFSKKTLEEIQIHFPSASHAQGLNPDYDIVIPLEEYGFPKIECKVCGSARDNKQNRYTKVPESLFENSESKFVRIKYLNNFNEHVECYFKLSSLKKYYNKMKNNTKVVEGDNGRKIILWPTHLLDNMYTKINNTKDLIKQLEKDKKIKNDNSVETFFFDEDGKNDKMP